MSKKAVNTTLSFTGDFQQNATETLKTGAEVTILFDADRLPYERSTGVKGKAEWSISAFVQFSEDVIKEVKLAPAKKGETTLKGVFTVPAESNEVVLWFLNTGKSGNVYFDSNFGKNYHFPVVAEVVEVVETPAPAKKARAKKA
jgi:hypothetical protein